MVYSPLPGQNCSARQGNIPSFKCKCVWAYSGVIYIYIAVCNNFEPLIYISIYIYGVHCGKVLILKIVPGRKNSLTCSHMKIFLLNILKILYLYYYTGWKVNFLVEPFPQCTRYITACFLFWAYCHRPLSQ